MVSVGRKGSAVKSMQTEDFPRTSWPLVLGSCVVLSCCVTFTMAIPPSRPSPRTSPSPSPHPPGHAQHPRPSSCAKGDDTLPQRWRPSLLDFKHPWIMTALISNKGVIRTDQGRAGAWYLVWTGNSLKNDPPPEGFQISRAGGDVGRHQPETCVHEASPQPPEGSLRDDPRRV